MTNRPLIAIIVMAVLLFGCTGGGPPQSSTPDVLSFTSQPGEIELWETSDISWSVKNATSVTLSLEGTVILQAPADGTYTFEPTEAGTFVFGLVASNDVGTMEDTVSVVVNDVPPTFLEPFGFGVDLDGGNNNHNPFEVELTFTLVGRELTIEGSIPYVDVPPTRAVLREGSFWAHFVTPGDTVLEFPLQGELDGPVDLGAELDLTWEQVKKLRDGQYYLEVDTSKTALGPILPTSELLAAGGTIQVNLSGIPVGDVVLVRFVTDYQLVDGGPAVEISVPGTELTDLVYGEYRVEPEPYIDEADAEYSASVSVSPVVVGLGLNPSVDVVFEGVPSVQ